MKRIFILVVMNSLTISCWAQFSYEPIVNIGFQQNSHSQFTAGLEYHFADTEYIFVGAGVLATPYHQKWYWLPYADISFHPERYDGFFYGNLQASTRHVKPEVGFAFFNALNLGIGYAIPYKEEHSNPVVKGFTVSLKFRLSDDSKVYPKFM